MNKKRGIKKTEGSEGEDYIFSELQLLKERKLQTYLPVGIDVGRRSDQDGRKGPQGDNRPGDKHARPPAQTQDTSFLHGVFPGDGNCIVTAKIPQFINSLL
jgi:hypothetical protein